MSSNISTYSFTVLETYLDVFGHVNNATYLTLYEEARWDIITKNGYGLKKVLETGLGPVILELKIAFLKELRLREEILIESEFLSCEKKIATMKQRMVRSGEVCSTLDVTFGLFSLKERKLVSPTEEWLKGMGK